MRKFFAAPVLLTMLALALGAGPALAQSGPIKITAVELGWALGENEAAASKNYYGRKLNLSGRISGINMDDGRPCLLFDAVDAGQYVGNLSADKVREKTRAFKYQKIAYYFSPDQSEMMAEVLAAMLGNADYAVTCEIKENKSANQKPGVCVPR